MAVKFEYTGKLGRGNIWDNNSSKKITVEIDDDDLNVTELLEEFMNFMKATGYNFDLGDHLEVVNDFKNNFKVNLAQSSTGTSDPAFGAVPPVELTVSDGDNFTLEELVNEVNRLKSLGMIESVAVVTARSNLKYREV